MISFHDLDDKNDVEENFDNRRMNKLKGPVSPLFNFGLTFSNFNESFCSFGDLRLLMMTNPIGVISRTLVIILVPHRTFLRHPKLWGSNHNQIAGRISIILPKVMPPAVAATGHCLNHPGNNDAFYSFDENQIFNPNDQK